MPYRNALVDAFSFARIQSEIDMSPEAWVLWEREYERLTAGPGGLLGAATNRGEAHTRRLAMIYAVLDRSDVVQLEHLQAALAVWDYCFDSASYLFGGLTGQVTTDQILTTLRERKSMSRNEFFNLFSRNQDKSKIEEALATLLVRGLARFEKQQPPSGRPTERWHLTEKGAR